MRLKDVDKVIDRAERRADLQRKLDDRLWLPIFPTALLVILGIFLYRVHSVGGGFWMVAGLGTVWGAALMADLILACQAFSIWRKLNQLSK